MTNKRTRYTRTEFTKKLKRELSSSIGYRQPYVAQTESFIMHLFGCHGCKLDRSQCDDMCWVTVHSGRVSDYK